MRRTLQLSSQFTPRMIAGSRSRSSTADLSGRACAGVVAAAAHAEAVAETTETAAGRALLAIRIRLPRLRRADLEQDRHPAEGVLHADLAAAPAPRILPPGGAARRLRHLGRPHCGAAEPPQLQF